MTIDRNSPISMYVQISNQLEEKILSGVLKPSEKLPIETEIMEQYGVSRITARLAFQNLEEKGLIVRKRGKGTFVIDSLIRHDLGSMNAIYDSFKAQDIEAKLEEMKVIETPTEVYEKMGKGFEKSLYFRRNYVRNNVVLGYANVYFPVHLSQVITWHQAEEQSGYSLLTQLAGYNLKYADFSFRTLSCNKEQAELLNISESHPVLRLTRISYNTTDVPIEFLSLILRSDTCEFNFRAPGDLSIVDGIQVVSENSRSTS
ncbi:GntR family transcriptional regulator [Bacillus sp. OV194]|nr:GntR family transcriptional regulator [Bacillus sp. OV194]